MWHFLKRLIPGLVGATLAVLSLSASAAPFAYIGNNEVNTVTVIDTASNTVVATVAVGGSAATWVAINPAGTRVYVGN